MTKTGSIAPSRDRRPWAIVLSLAVFAIAAVLSADAAAKSAQKNAIKSVRVLGSGDSRDVVIETTLEPTFTVFRLSDPMRVVIDVSGGDIAKLDGPVSVDDGVVTTVGVQQFNADGFSIGRLIVGFNHDVSYDVKAEGTSIIVRSGVSNMRIERATPPPAAPVDLGAQERLEAARKDASALAEKATAERKAADVAAATAKAEHQEAMRVAAEAAKAQKEAAVAKADADQRKKQASEAAERDRAKANEALASAEARLQQVQAQQRSIAVSQAEADRKAAQAEQARKDAEQAAALAEAKHKVRVAELEEQIAKAQSEKREATAAEARAQAAKKDADNAQRVAMQAKADADKARRETDTKLEAIAVREREAQKQLDAAEGAKRDAQKQLDAAAGAQREAQTKLSAAAVRDREAQTKLDAAAGAQRDAQTKLDAAAGAQRDAQTKLDAAAGAQRDAQTKLAAAAGVQRDAQTKLATAAGVQRDIDSQKAQLASERDRLEKIKSTLAEREKQLQVRESEPTLVSAATTVPPAPADKLIAFKGVSRSGDAVLLALDGEVDYKVERVDNPPRLVIDLLGAERKAKRVTYGVDAPNVRRVRMGEHDGMVRAVLDLASSDVDHEVSTDAKGVRITVHKIKAAHKNEEVAVADNAAKPADSKSIAQIKKVDFGQNGPASRVTLTLTADVQARVDDRSKKAWVLELTGAHVDQALEKSLDTSAYGGIVRLVSTYQASRDPQIVNVVVQLSGPATGRLVRDNGNVVWEITGQKSDKAAPTPAPVPVADNDEPSEPEVAAPRTPQTAGYASAASAIARAIPAQAAGRQRRVSLNFKDADIVNVIRLIADVTGENIITSEDVKGKVTVRLRNVPWETALDTILKSKGYDKVRQNNILRIAPTQQIQAEREAEVARQKANEQIEEKVIKIITVNYATAGEIVSQLKSLLSSRGTVQTDERTNTIIVEDVKSNIDRLVELVRRLDRQTPQVLIEARIVEASTNYSESLGVQWGGQGQMSTAQGNPTGLSFPSDIIATGGNTGVSTGVTTPANYAVNLPAAISTGGSVGLVFGSAGGSQLLQLRLSALETKGTGRIISSPRVATLDNRTARISQGVDIPITVTSAAGANTRFVPANLELEVTPHVTNDGSIVMRIIARRNEPNFARTGAFGDPTIERREAQTEVLVADGDTTVIGGIYTRNTTRQYSQVPVLANIPVLGWLFKSRADTDTKSELLIFISPKIVNRQESILQSGEAVGG